MIRQVFDTSVGLLSALLVGVAFGLNLTLTIWGIGQNNYIWVVFAFSTVCVLIAAFILFRKPKRLR